MVDGSRWRYRARVALIAQVGDKGKMRGRDGAKEKKSNCFLSCLIQGEECRCAVRLLRNSGRRFFACFFYDEQLPRPAVRGHSA